MSKHNPTDWPLGAGAAYSLLVNPARSKGGRVTAERRKMVRENREEAIRDLLTGHLERIAGKVGQLISILPAPAVRFQARALRWTLRTDLPL